MHAAYHGVDEGWSSTGLGYEEKESFSVTSNGVQPGAWRRRPTPDWALSDAKVKAVIVAFLEHRAYCNGHRTACTQLSLDERRRLAETRLQALEAGLLKQIDGLQARWRDARKSGQHDAAAQLERKIEELDSRILVNRRAGAIAAGAIYYYLRAGLVSVETAELLKIKPPLVRQIVWRLEKIAGALGFGREIKVQPRPETLEKQMIKKVAQLRARHVSWADIKLLLQQPDKNPEKFYWLAHRHGVAIPREKHHILTPAEKAVILDGYRKGLPYGAIKQQIGASNISVISYFLHTQGMRRGRGWRPKV